MKRIPKWLLPALTCLTAAGAAVLPAQVSRIGDAGRFGQVSIETLDAGSPSPSAPSTFLERLELYAEQYSSDDPVLSFRDRSFEDADGSKDAGYSAQQAQELLVGGELVPEWVFQEEPFDNVTVTRLLLWDPGAENAAQGPSAYWDVEWSYFDKAHQKHIQLALDAETGLPVRLQIHDTNLSKWMPYGSDGLRKFTERYFALLGLAVQEVVPDGFDALPGLNLCYSVAGTSARFISTRYPTTCSIELDTGWISELLQIGTQGIADHTVTDQTVSVSIGRDGAGE